MNGPEKNHRTPEAPDPAAASAGEAAHAAQEQRDLNAIVHQLLIVGLAISITLMLIGLGLALAKGTGMPRETPGFADALDQATSGEASGFMTLGLLVLIATPIMRVIGSIFTFIYERDWRYALITTVVLMIVITSLLSGEG